MKTKNAAVGGQLFPAKAGGCHQEQERNEAACFPRTYYAGLLESCWQVEEDGGQAI
jgi:hypothetical protein|tara:strand:+ start:655 stop:822 length:168 start_codon:yes stop_codon:yes gene_type:complete